MKPGTVIAGKYRLVRRLGDGAMGAVWEAINELTQRAFAIKLIHASAVGGDELRTRMMREARAAGRLHHRNVIEVYDVGETDAGDPFLVMELLRGETLDELLQRKQQLPVNLTCAIGIEVARALAAAHDAGIIHRDLKPANIFLHREPDLGVVVKVLDFGVSKVTSDQNASATTTGTAIGSPAYMSPEQAVGAPDIDARSDLWSVGVLLLEAASGTPAFKGDTIYAIVGNILHGEIPRLGARAPNVDSRLSEIVGRCLVRDRSARIPSARELAAQLELLLPSSAEAVLEDLEEEPTLAKESPVEKRQGQDSVIATKPYVRHVDPAAPEEEPDEAAAATGYPLPQPSLVEMPPGSVTASASIGRSKIPVPLVIGVAAMFGTAVLAIIVIVSVANSNKPTAPATIEPPAVERPASTVPTPTAAPVDPSATPETADAAAATTETATPTAEPPPSAAPPAPAAPQATETGALDSQAQAQVRVSQEHGLLRPCDGQDEVPRTVALALETEAGAPGGATRQRHRADLDLLLARHR